MALTASEADADQAELETFAPPSKPLKVPMAAIFPPQLAVAKPPSEAAAKESALAKIMNNLRRTFMPAVVTPQAVVSGTPR